MITKDNAVIPMPMDTTETNNTILALVIAGTGAITSWLTAIIKDRRAASNVQLKIDKILAERTDALFAEYKDNAKINRDAAIVALADANARHAACEETNKMLIRHVIDLEHSVFGESKLKLKATTTTLEVTKGSTAKGEGI